MPPKAVREFIVNEASGEVRCRDPSCGTTQCGQCNKEQNRRRRKAKHGEAAKADKEREDQAAVEQARAAEAAGKTHNWTYDNEQVGEGNHVLEALQQSENSD